VIINLVLAYLMVVTEAFVVVGELLTVFRCHRLFAASTDHYCSLPTSCTQQSYHQLLLQGIS